MEKRKLRALLEQSDVRINYTKLDGTERTITATLRIPEDKRPKEPTGEGQDKRNRRELPVTHAHVFDRDIGEWRTVILERITEVEPV